MENGEWDFHHVEGVKHNSLFAKHDEQATSGNCHKRVTLHQLRNQ